MNGYEVVTPILNPYDPVNVTVGFQLYQVESLVGTESHVDCLPIVLCDIPK